MFFFFWVCINFVTFGFVMFLRFFLIFFLCCSKLVSLRFVVILLGLCLCYISRIDTLEVCSGFFSLDCNFAYTSRLIFMKIHNIKFLSSWSLVFWDLRCFVFLSTIYVLMTLLRFVIDFFFIIIIEVFLKFVMFVFLFWHLCFFHMT